MRRRDGKLLLLGLVLGLLGSTLPRASRAPAAADAAGSATRPESVGGALTVTRPEGVGSALTATRLDPAGSGRRVELDAIPEPQPAPAPAVVETLLGSASYYANSLAGRRTASGERYDPRALVAAHRSLPFGTRVRVTNLLNDRSVEVRIVDRGPFARGRLIDLSRRAAEQLDFIRRGHTRVRVEVLQ